MPTPSTTHYPSIHLLAPCTVPPQYLYVKATLRYAEMKFDLAHIVDSCGLLRPDPQPEELYIAEGIAQQAAWAAAAAAALAGGREAGAPHNR